MVDSEDHAPDGFCFYLLNHKTSGQITKERQIRVNDQTTLVEQIVIDKLSTQNLDRIEDSFCNMPFMQRRSRLRLLPWKSRQYGKGLMARKR